MAAARVGGIHANNSHPAGFLRDNLLIQDNVIDAAYRSGVEKFVFLGSSCIYPKLAPQPIKEDYLLTGSLEPTNEWYAIAKIAGIKMCQAYRREYGFNAISLMPTNLYGPGDNFDLQSSHVLPALIRKFHEAKRRNDKNVEIWGTGTPRREFLHVDDLADAVVYLLQKYDAEPIVNIGWGEDLTIRELAEVIMSAIGYSGALTFDHSKPDGTPRKLLDVSRLHTSWLASAHIPSQLASKVPTLGSKSTPQTRDCKSASRVNRNSSSAFSAKVFVMRDDIVLFPRDFGTLRVLRDLLSLGVSTKNGPRRSNGCWD